jgi:hypothetical protein
MFENKGSPPEHGTIEAVEKNSVSPEGPSHQRDKRTTGCMWEVIKDEIII